MQRSLSTHAVWDLDGSKTSCEPVLIPSTLISGRLPCLCNVAGGIAVVHSALRCASSAVTQLMYSTRGEQHEPAGSHPRKADIDKLSFGTTKVAHAKLELHRKGPVKHSQIYIHSRALLGALQLPCIMNSHAQMPACEAAMQDVEVHLRQGDCVALLDLCGNRILLLHFTLLPRDVIMRDIRLHRLRLMCT